MQALNARIEHSCVSFSERLIFPGLDRCADTCHERVIKIQIMHHGEAHGQHLVSLEQMAQIGTREPSADRAVALRVDRLLVALILLIFDISSGDTEHEQAISNIKSICSAAEIPVMAAGNINRMEDVKKLLYAGCAKVVLNFSKANNISLLEEVSKRFGKEKMVVCRCVSCRCCIGGDLYILWCGIPF